MVRGVRDRESRGEGTDVSRSLWRCRNPACPEPHGATLGRLTADGMGLALDPTVARFAVFLDTGRAEVRCPACGAARDFRGAVVRAGAG